MSEQDADDMTVPEHEGAVSWRVIKVVDFASECITDLERAESWVRRRRKKQARVTDANRAGAPSRDGDVTAGAWQPQRIAMRRRTTGHRSYRMPVRLRLGLISRGHSRKHRVKRVKLSATTGVTGMSLMPRLQRRRMRDLMLQKGRLSPDTQAEATTVKELDGDESARRGGAAGTWLESHAWLAKRMRMDVRWRGKWVVPVTGRTWGQRHVVRRLKCGAVFQDCSFLSCFQIEGNSAEVGGWVQCRGVVLMLLNVTAVAVAPALNLIVECTRRNVLVSRSCELCACRSKPRRTFEMHKSTN
jgi:hypothetical protein